MTHISENVDYLKIYKLGHGFQVALIAFAGPGIANGLLFILSLYWLKNEKTKNKPYLFYFLFWFNLMNLGNFYDYVPMRTFALQSGDMAAIEIGLNISPWWIYVIFGYLVAFLIWNFFTSTLISAYINLKLQTTLSKAALMITCVLILFGFSGGIIGVLLTKGNTPYGVISQFLSLTSFVMIPGVIAACWPKRTWVTQALKINSGK